MYGSIKIIHNFVGFSSKRNICYLFINRGYHSYFTLINIILIYFYFFEGFKSDDYSIYLCLVHCFRRSLSASVSACRILRTRAKVLVTVSSFMFQHFVPQFSYPYTHSDYSEGASQWEKKLRCFVSRVADSPNK